MRTKNIIPMVTAIMMILTCLCGCDNTEKKKVFINKINKVEITTTFIYKGDKVLKQISKNRMYYSDTPGKTKEAFEKDMSPMQQEYRKIKGLEDAIVYFDTYAEETVTMNIDELDFDMLKKVTGISTTGTRGLSMKKTQEQFEASGFTEVK
ncbi:Lipoprotein [Kluyvera sp. M-M157-B]|nr:lipoprotein [Klebsiella sp. WP8-S18-ESBL-06]